MKQQGGPVLETFKGSGPTYIASASMQMLLRQPAPFAISIHGYWLRPSALCPRPVQMILLPMLYFKKQGVWPHPASCCLAWLLCFCLYNTQAWQLAILEQEPLILEACFLGTEFCLLLDIHQIGWSTCCKCLIQNTNHLSMKAHLRMCILLGARPARIWLRVFQLYYSRLLYYEPQS